MKIVALAKLVPDLVEELEVDESGTSLDLTWLRLVINELDDHAIEQSILLKEKIGAHVTVVAPDNEGVDDILFTASAKGADRLIKVMADFESGVNNHALAQAITPMIKDLAPDLILTGVQSNEDLDGSLGPLLAGCLGFSYVGYIAGITLGAGKSTVLKEYPGGLSAEMEVSLPAVLGIQVAEQPPRYVAVSKVRQAMNSAQIEEFEVGELNLEGGPTISRIYPPEVGEGATMLEGSLDDIADELIGILKDLGVA